MFMLKSKRLYTFMTLYVMSLGNYVESKDFCTISIYIYQINIFLRVHIKYK